MRAPVRAQHNSSLSSLCSRLRLMQSYIRTQCLKYVFGCCASQQRQNGHVLKKDKLSLPHRSTTQVDSNTFCTEIEPYLENQPGTFEVAQSYPNETEGVRFRISLNPMKMKVPTTWIQAPARTKTRENRN